MEVHQYFENKKAFQNGILEYLDDENKALNDFQPFVDKINEMQIPENTKELTLFLQFLLQIANNHRRVPHFLEKILNILKFLKNPIKQTFSNSEIFDLFQSNKRLLLFLSEENILTFDQTIFEIIKDETYQKKFYLLYFWPEIESFLSEEMKNQIEEENRDILEKSSRSFENYRKEGENESKISKMIRNDSYKEFVEYMNTSSVFYSSEVFQSQFETNQFLVLKNPSLIEYATFFGAIRIFQFLKMNNAILKPSLWLYAIHSNNLEMIHVLENEFIEPDDKTYVECYIESIKCHHNTIANYIKEHLLADVSKDVEFEISSKIVQFLNFYFFQIDF